MVEVGSLPASAFRQDTGEEVHDLAGVGAKWRRACGWFSLDDLATMDLSQIKATDAQRQAIAAAIAAAVDKRTRRRQFVTNLRQDAASAKGQHWDFIDAYSPIPFEGSQNTGEQWPQPPGGATVAQHIATLYLRSDILVEHQARTAYHFIRVIDVILLMIDVLEQLIDAADLEPPTPR